MKRSEINDLLNKSIEFINKMNFKLPPFAYWSLEDWKTKGDEYDEIFANMLGWDITDFGSSDFNKTGLILFTLRNGNAKDHNNSKTYAEKLMIANENQVTPFHFHWNKTEDIINRGGGNLLVRLYQSCDDGSFSKSDIQVSIDGCRSLLKAGSVIRLTPGESITMTTGLYHKFWAEEGFGSVLLGEVSKVNDDTSDNRFFEQIGRFPEILEDQSPLYLLCQDYKKFL